HVVGGPLVVDAAAFEHDDVRLRGFTSVGLAGGVRMTVTRNDPARRLVETKPRETEGVLDTVRGEERRDSLQVAAAEDERDDRLRGDGIEAGRWRVVEHDRGPIDQGARDGDAAA